MFQTRQTHLGEFHYARDTRTRIVEQASLTIVDIVEIFKLPQLNCQRAPLKAALKQRLFGTPLDNLNINRMRIDFQDLSHLAQFS